MQPTSLTLMDRAPAADLLADAFYDNPAHTFIYPDPAKRRRQLRWLMHTNLGGQFTVGRSFAARGSEGQIAAMAFWHAPGAPKATLKQLVRFGFFSMPVLHGWPAFSRMLKSVDELEARREQCLAGQDSWYLNNMVVDPSHRGQGLGSSLLRQELTDTVKPSGFPASLTTQKKENVSFYRHLGFEVADHSRVGGAGGFENWIMIFR